MQLNEPITEPQRIRALADLFPNLDDRERLAKLRGADTEQLETIDRHARWQLASESGFENADTGEPATERQRLNAIRELFPDLGDAARQAKLNNATPEQIEVVDAFVRKSRGIAIHLERESELSALNHERRSLVSLEAAHVKALAELDDSESAARAAALDGVAQQYEKLRSAKRDELNAAREQLAVVEQRLAELPQVPA
jgi:hypothetical protein